MLKVQLVRGQVRVQAQAQAWDKIKAKHHERVINTETIKALDHNHQLHKAQASMAKTSQLLLAAATRTPAKARMLLDLLQAETELTNLLQNAKAAPAKIVALPVAEAQVALAPVVLAAEALAVLAAEAPLAVMQTNNQQ
jgi:hypothetical protein